MVNMDGPMVAATAAPPSKRRRTARRPRVAISDTYRPFAGGGCAQRTPATKPTKPVIDSTSGPEHACRGCSMVGDHVGHGPGHIFIGVGLAAVAGPSGQAIIELPIA